MSDALRVEGLAALPHLTESELDWLATAVAMHRVRTGDAIGWSMLTAVQEALIWARVDGERRRADAEWEGEP